MALPPTGRSKDEILAELEDLRAGDGRWQEGRTFGMVYDAGPEAHDVLEAVASMFLHDNALNTVAFPSLGRIQSEVVGITADLLHGEQAAGFLTSGGTESILMAVKAERERGRTERGFTEPEMVVPVSAHAAFHKAAHYFGIAVRRVPVRPAAASRVKPMTPKSLVNDSSGSSASKARSADSVPARASPSAWSRN